MKLRPIPSNRSALDGLITLKKKQGYTSFKDRIQANIDTLTNNNKTIRAQIANLNFLKINIDKGN